MTFLIANVRFGGRADISSTKSAPHKKGPREEALLFFSFERFIFRIPRNVGMELKCRLYRRLL